MVIVVLLALLSGFVPAAAAPASISAGVDETVGAPSIASAPIAGAPRRYCYNWDLWPPQGQPVNDLHITLLGPQSLAAEYLGALNPWGPATQMVDPATGALSLWYHGVTIINQMVHIGFCTTRPVFWVVPDQSSGVALPPHYWTLDGQPVGLPIPMPGVEWLWQPEPDRWRLIFSNDGASSLLIDQLQVAVVDDPIPLDQLMWDQVDAMGLPWDAARPVREAPTRQRWTVDSFFDITYRIDPGQHAVLRALVRDPANPSSPPLRLLSQATFDPPPRPTYCYNWDFFNTTGVPANDLHIALEGIRQLSNIYLGALNPFGPPHPNSGYDPVLDVYHLWFEGVVVQPGGLAHIGFCTDRPVVEIPGLGGLPPFYWTRDGQPIPDRPIPIPGFDWVWHADGSFRLGLSNGGTAPLEVVPGSLELAWLETPLHLDEMEWGAVEARFRPAFFDIFYDYAPLAPGEVRLSGQLLIRESPTLPSRGMTALARLQVRSPGSSSSSATRVLAQAVPPPPPRYCYNWDFFNQTGQEANDLHIGLVGPTALTNIYTGSLNPFGMPDGGSGLDPVTGIYSLNFSGATVLPGGLAHIGFCSDRPVFRTQGEGGLPPFYWTWNGQPLPGGPPLPGFSWSWGTSQGSSSSHLRLGLSNDNSIPIEIVSLSLHSVSSPLSLDELTSDRVASQPELWRSSSSAVLPPGMSSFFDVFTELSLDKSTPLLARAVVHGAGGPSDQVVLVSQGFPGPRPRPRYCYNWDFFNRTGQTANDLHLALRGPTRVGDIYMGSLNPFGAPDPQSGYHPELGLYLLWWSGAEVPPGGLVHIGFCTDRPIADLAWEPGAPGAAPLPPFRWTRDGVPIGGPIPVPGYDWWWMSDGSLEFGLSLASGLPMDLHVSSIEMARAPEPVSLENLNYDSLSSLIPPGDWHPMEPVAGTLLLSGETLFFRPPSSVCPSGVCVSSATKQALADTPYVVRFTTTSTTDPGDVVRGAAQGITGPDLTVEKTIQTPAGRNTFYLGEAVTFEIVVENTGTTSLELLPLSDTFDNTCLTYEAKQAEPPESDFDNGAGVINWADLTWTTGGSLAPGDLVTTTVTLEVTGVSAAGWNIATVSGAQDGNGATVPSQSSSVSFTCMPADNSIGGVTFLDEDGDGIHDTGENNGIAGVPIVVTNVATSASYSTLSGILGTFELSSLPFGVYTVSAPPTHAGLVRTSSSPQTVTLSSVLKVDVLDVDFGYQPTTGVELAALSAERTARGAVVRWSTTAETQVDAFQVWRANAPSGPFAAASPLIPATGHPGGASYEWLDTKAMRDVTYWYRLQVLPNGIIVGPVESAATVGVARPARLYLPVILH
jgi:hypothetical protein